MTYPARVEMVLEIDKVRDSEFRVDFGLVHGRSVCD